MEPEVLLGGHADDLLEAGDEIGGEDAEGFVVREVGLGEDGLADGDHLVLEWPGAEEAAHEDGGAGGEVEAGRGGVDLDGVAEEGDERAVGAVLVEEDGEGGVLVAPAAHGLAAETALFGDDGGAAAEVVAVEEALQEGVVHQAGDGEEGAHAGDGGDAGLPSAEVAGGKDDGAGGLEDEFLDLGVHLQLHVVAPIRFGDAIGNAQGLADMADEVADGETGNTVGLGAALGDAGDEDVVNCGLGAPATVEEGKRTRAHAPADGISPPHGHQAVEPPKPGQQEKLKVIKHTRHAAIIANHHFYCVCRHSSQ